MPRNEDQQIQEAIGCGHKPMLHELLGIVGALIQAAKQLQDEHADLIKFAAGFKKVNKCTCDICESLRKIPGWKQ